MVLAATYPLVLAEIQLLADCFGPLFVTEIPVVADALILRGLLQASPAVHASRTCFLLAITETGRSHVEIWIGRHGKHKHKKAKHGEAA